MKLKQQVSSKKPSKRLKELGVKQKSLWYWNYQAFITGYQWILTMSRPDFGEDQEIEQTTEGYSAFTVAELGEMLPRYNVKSFPWTWETAPIFLNGENQFEINFLDDRYVDDRETMQHFSLLSEPIYASTEADSRAAMLIYLLENKFITL